MTNIKIAIIGLGYVGMPLAAAFSSKFKVFGFDLNSTRINELKSGFDRTLELDESAMKKVAESGMSFAEWSKANADGVEKVAAKYF